MFLENIKNTLDYPKSKKLLLLFYRLLTQSNYFFSFNISFLNSKI